MFNNPYYQQFNLAQPYSNPANQLIRVTGLEGAKAYQMSPNSTVALFDNNEDIMYVKTTDGAGFPTIRTFKFEEITVFSKNSENSVDFSQFITRNELLDILKDYKGGNINGKQSVPQSKQSN